MVLGPTLYFLYKNDLMLKTNSFQPTVFADETNLFFKGRNLNDEVQNVNDNLDEIFEWCNATKLTLNLDKTN